MGKLESTVVSLRIFGEDLDTDEITALLGTPPSKAYRKGEPRSARPGSPLRPQGSWHLSSDRAIPGDLDRQIGDLLARTTDDPAVWRAIHARYQADLFAGLFMDSTNDGLTLTPETLAAAALRGLAIGLDIYGPVSEDQA
jgi:hypothetical protein